MSEPALALGDVRRAYRQGDGALEVLRGITFELRPGEIAALTGPSGSGKTTLLQIAGLLDRPDGGEVRVGGRDVGRLSDRRLSELRGRHLGFVFQFHQLLPEFSARENLVLPQLVIGRRPREAARRADELLERVGLAARASHRPARLSGGEQQRVAIARALANRPRVVLADEPTGNLDADNAARVTELFLEVARDSGVAALVATHNPDLAARLDRRFELAHGRIVA